MPNTCPVCGKEYTHRGMFCSSACMEEELELQREEQELQKKKVMPKKEKVNDD